MKRVPRYINKFFTSLYKRVSTIPPKMGTVKKINHYMLPHTLDDFIEEDTLGSGAYGDVVRMREKSTKHPFAMKICPNNEETRRHLINEILIHGDLYHPNIPRFYGWISSKRDSEKQLTTSPTGSQGSRFGKNWQEIQN